METKRDDPRGHLPERARAMLIAVLDRELTTAHFKKARAEIRLRRMSLPGDETAQNLDLNFFAYDSFVLGFAEQLRETGRINFYPDASMDELHARGLPGCEELLAFYLDPNVECPAFRSYVNAIELLRLMILEFARDWPERVAHGVDPGSVDGIV